MGPLLARNVKDLAQNEGDAVGTVQAEKHAVGTAEHHLLQDEALLGLRNGLLPLCGKSRFELGFVIFKRDCFILFWDKKRGKFQRRSS